MVAGFSVISSDDGEPNRFQRRIREGIGVRGYLLVLKELC
jgi:hypothetical protein